MIDQVTRRLDGKRDEIVALTRELVRIPTINPPGDAYAPCAELVGERLRRRGFAVAYLRAEGTPGDSDRLPRVNVIARRESARPGPCVHFNGHIDVVPAGQGWTFDPWAGEVRDGRGLRPRHLRHEGRARRRDRGRRDAAGERHPAAGRARDLRHGRRGIGRLWRGRLSRAAGPVLPAARRSRDHPRAAQRRPGLHRPSRRLVGRDRDPWPDRARLDAVPGRLCRPPHGRGARRLRARAVADPGRGAARRCRWCPKARGRRRSTSTRSMAGRRKA